MMLQTCTRCRSRRIKCDSLLPACQNCAKSDVQCTIYDEALQEQIPRSYVQSLNQKISELTSQVTLQKSHAARTPVQYAATSSAVSPAATYQAETRYILMPEIQRYMYLERSPPAITTLLCFEALSDSLPPPDLTSSFETESFSPNVAQVDKSILTPSSIRHLLARYHSCIRPEFDLVDADLLAQDGLGLRKLPLRSRFETLMVCAIAAARESYQNPSWRVLAHVCREWAGEDAALVLGPADGNSLTAILLLLVYELAEPSRGSIWELMDLAIRTIVQLGWHRQGHNENQLSPFDARSGVDLNEKTTQDRLLNSLKKADRALSFIFNRPTMSGSWQTAPSLDEDFVSKLYQDVQQNIYGPGQLYDTNECPFVGQTAELILSIEAWPMMYNPIICEAWILLLPLCVRHRQCVFCFQEADDSTQRGMRYLRRRLLEAGLCLAQLTHQVMFSATGFLPPMVASSRAIISGCTIVLSDAKQWNPGSVHVKALTQCTEILAHCLPHWKGGQGYLQVWTTITGLIDRHQAKLS